MVTTEGKEATLVGLSSEIASRLGTLRARLVDEIYPEPEPVTLVAVMHFPNVLDELIRQSEESVELIISISDFLIKEVYPKIK